MLPDLFGGLGGGGLSARAFLSAQVLGERQWSRGAFFHGALHGLLVAAQGLALYRLADLAGLNVEEDLYLPWLERITVHGATDQLLHQAVEAVEPRFAIKGLHEHILSFSTLSAPAIRNLNK